ncbi:hypothetical protein THAOC_30156, partial [Thalassiosira oceanica]
VLENQAACGESALSASPVANEVRGRFSLLTEAAQAVQLRLQRPTRRPGSQPSSLKHAENTAKWGRNYPIKSVAKSSP